MAYKRKPGTWAVPGRIAQARNSDGSVNARIRRILRDECLPMGETLMKAWGYKRVHSVYMRMHRRDEPFRADEVTAFCETVGISGPERAELHRIAAREWGFEV
jgi:hypothetical protein